MADHRPRKGREGFLGYFDRTGNEKFIVRNHARGKTHGTASSLGVLLFDETDVAAALDAGDADIGEIFRVCGQPHVFFQIVTGNVITEHGTAPAFAILHDDLGHAFDETADPMPAISAKADQAMEKNDDERAAQRWKK